MEPLSRGAALLSNDEEGHVQFGVFILLLFKAQRVILGITEECVLSLS